MEILYHELLDNIKLHIVVWKHCLLLKKQFLQYARKCVLSILLVICYPLMLYGLLSIY